MKPTNEEAAARLRAIEERNAPGLESPLAADRAAAVESTSQAITAACAAEADRLRRLLIAAEQERVVRIGSAQAKAEHARRARAAELLQQMFAPAAHGLRGLIDGFRAEPSRRTAVAIRAAWDRFDATARAELGDPLGWHVVATLLVDSILADASKSAAINKLSEDQFGGGDAVSGSCSRFATAQAPGDIQAALESAESALAGVAARAAAAGGTPEPRCVELHTLRRSCATTRDLAIARAEVLARQAAEQRAEFQRTYVAPPSLRDYLRERLLAPS